MNDYKTYIEQHSKLDKHRKYIGMSSAGDCPRRIMLNYRNGVNTDYISHLTSFRGYKLESIAKEILIGSGLMKPGSERELLAFDGLVKGHTDGETVSGELLEIKSKNKKNFDQILSNGKIPHRDFMQVQSYMLFGNYSIAKVVVMCSETFETQTFTIHSHAGVQASLREKFRRLSTRINEEELPTCECKHCTR